MDYFEKLESNPYRDLIWNIPEQKQGRINVIGGNKHSFRTEIKTAEYLATTYPLEAVSVVLPDVLKNQLPVLPNLVFIGSTESGSFGSSDQLTKTMEHADYNLLIGDLSKNSVTGHAIVDACSNLKQPLLITKDTIDLISEIGAEKVLLNNVTVMLSLTQLQKLLRAIYYPKMLTLSQSLVQVAELLHKFTISYPVLIVTLHNGQLLVAEEGQVKAVALEKTNYTPVNLWMGEAAARVAALSIYNPSNRIAATVAAILS